MAKKKTKSKGLTQEEIKKKTVAYRKKFLKEYTAANSNIKRMEIKEKYYPSDLMTEYANTPIDKKKEAWNKLIKKLIK